MRRERFEVDYALRFTGGRCFCGTGTGSSGVDRIFLRDERGNFVVPGTHIKGLVRQRCEDLLGTLGADCADPHDQERPAPTDHLITRIFGAPGPADITCVFADARCDDEIVQSSQDRFRMRMNRRLGRPEHKALFNTRYAETTDSEPLRGTITVWFESDGSVVPPELTLLCAGLRLVDAVGGDTSTGTGAVEVAVEAIRGATVKLTLEEVLAPLGREGWSEACDGGGDR